MHLRSGLRAHLALATGLLWARPGRGITAVAALVALLVLLDPHPPQGPAAPLRALSAVWPTYAVDVSAAGTVEFRPTHPGQRSEVSPKLVLETTSIRRDAELIRSGSAARDEGGSVIIPRGVAAERIDQNERGIEQSWRFSGRPSGEGDLVVRVRAEGLPLEETSHDGLRFGSPGASAGVRYGAATWIDARGERTHLDPVFAAGAIELRVPAHVVEHAAYPAVLDPVVSPELELIEPIYVHFPTSKIVSIASDGSNYLTVWLDVYGGLRSSRDTPGGLPLDPTSSLIIQTLHTAANRITAVDLAFNGTDYFVVWEREVNSVGFIEAARIGVDGALLDPVPIPIWTDNASMRPKVACDGATGCLVVWEDLRNGAKDIYGARVTMDGQLLDPQSIPISFAPDIQISPNLVFDGTNYVVVWYDDRASQSLYMARVTPAGQVLDVDGIYLVIANFTDNTTFPMEYGAGTIMLARSTVGNSWRAFRIDGTGAVLDPIPIDLDHIEEDQPPLTFDGTNFVFVLPWFNDLYARRISPAGVLLDVAPIVVATTMMPQYKTGASGIASCAGTSLILWRATEGSNKLLGTRITAPDAVVLDPDGFVVARRSNQQAVPGVGTDGKDFFLTWVDDAVLFNGGYNSFYGARVTATGQVLDPYGILLTGGVDEEVYTTTSESTVGFGGGKYLAFRRSANGGLGAKRVTQAGVVLDNNGISLGGAIGGFGWAFNDPYFLIVTAQSGTISSVLLDHNSNVPGNTFPIEAQAAVNDDSPAVATDGNSYIVVWLRPQGATDAVALARLSPAGLPMDPQPFIVAVGVQGSASMRPTIAFGGSSYLIVWESATAIVGELVDGSGAVLGAGVFTIAPPAVGQGTPSLGFDGTSFVVTWQKGADIVTARVATDGTVLDAPPVTISAGSTAPRLASTPLRRSLVVYRRFDPAAKYDTDRIRARFFSDDQDVGTPCGSATECGSGYCVEGVCCDSACGGEDATDCQSCAAVGFVGTCTPLAANTSCRPSGGICDSQEVCDGTAGTCPPDTLEPATTVCRPSGGSCDLAEQCTGAGAACPPDTLVANGTACDDDDTCTQSDVCQAGTCVGGNPVICMASDECHLVGDCGADTGICSDPAKSNGAPCSIGTCQGGQCEPMGPGSSSSSSASTGTAGGATGASSSSSEVTTNAGAGGTGNQGAGGGDPDPVDEGGCGCRAVGRLDEEPRGALGVALMLFGLMLRRAASRRARSRSTAP